MLTLPTNVKVLLVTKNHSVSEILTVLQTYSIFIIGESRWQEAKAKLPLLPSTVEKHFIGHLQRNKATEVVGSFDCIETVDSLTLAKAIELASAAINKTMPVFLQVNISNDPAKYGFSPQELPGVIIACQQYPHIQVTGLMTITAKQPVEQIRQDFHLMKQLQVRFGLAQLSMGMSADWQLAVAEGATIIRLGRALFDDV